MKRFTYQTLIAVYFFGLLFASACKRPVKSAKSQDASVTIYPRQTYSELVRAIRTEDGGFVLLGNVFTNKLGWDVFVIYLNSKGEEVNYNTSGGTGEDKIADAILTSSGSILAIGTTNSSIFNTVANKPSNFSNYLLLEASTKGLILNTKGFSDTTSLNKGLQSDAGYCITEILGDGIYIGGGSRNYRKFSFAPPGVNPTYEQHTLIKLSPNYQVQWQKTFGLNYKVFGPDSFYSYLKMNAITFDNSKNIYCYIKGTLGMDSAHYIAKVNSNGVLDWHKKLPFESEDVFSYALFDATSTNNILFNNGSLKKLQIFNNLGNSIGQKDLKLPTGVWIPRQSKQIGNSIFIVGSIASPSISLDAYGGVLLDNNDPYIMQLGLDGSLVDVMRIANVRGVAMSIVELPDNQFQVFGYKKSDGRLTSDLFSVKYTNNLKIVNP